MNIENLRFTDAETGDPIKISTEGLLGYERVGSISDSVCLLTLRYKGDKKLRYRAVLDSFDLIESANNTDGESFLCVHRYKAKWYREKIDHLINHLQSSVKCMESELSNLVDSINALEGCYK